MSKFATVAAEAGDKYLETLAQGQDRIVEYVRASREFMPQMPEAVTAAMPFSVPSPKEVADVQFRFADKLLDLQQKFYRRLYQAPSPKSAVKSASGRTTKAGSTKARASKARSAKTTAAKPRPVS